MPLHASDRTATSAARRRVLHLLAAASLLLPALSHGQNMRYPWEEYDKLIQRHTDLTAMDSGLFGDSVDLYTGSPGFSATDFSLPGTGIPIAVSRSMAPGNRADYRYDDLPMADWNLELPRLSGVFMAATGWASACSNNGVGQPPVVNVNGNFYRASNYWAGNRMVIPGRGSQDMLVAEANNVQRPTVGGPYPWLTADFTWFSCTASRKNAGGEGFVAHTPDGLRYTFDWQAGFFEPSIAAANLINPANASRIRSELYVTRVEDRFGNWVNYQYSNAANAPVRLNAITASDGRQVSFSYNARGHVQQISNGSQTWNYRYSYPDNFTGTLVGVDLPDGSSWSIDAYAITHLYFQYERSTGAGDIIRTCGYPGLMVNEPGGTARFVHPSGAVGEFTVGYSLRGRSNVPMVCNNYSTPYNDPNDDVALYPLAYHGVVMRQKRLSGPGVDTAEWNYSYGGNISFAPGTGPVCTSGDCSLPRCLDDSCAGTAVAVITGPEGSWTRHTYGNSYRYNEGKLLKVEEGSNAQNVLQTTTQSYLWPLAGSQFAQRLGATQQSRTAGYTSEYLRPTVQTVVTRDGATFSSSSTALDGMARPLTTVASSSLGFTRTENINYYDQLGHWLLGQNASRYNIQAGVETARTVYEPNSGLPIEQYAFGELQMRLSYHGDGQVESVTDGNGNITLASDWRRGIPQVIGYADGYAEVAAVDNLGRVTSTTDENGFTSTYAYDAMGRLAQRTYPANDSVAWNAVGRIFEKVGGAEYGLESGHWRLIETEGNRRRTLYFDAFWRPVVEESYDIANPAQTLSLVARRFDRLGRKVFESYPTRSMSDFRASMPGSYTGYDALGRVTSVGVDSEHGRLNTTTAYLSGLRRQTTNPRGYATVESFQAWDQPGYDLPVRVDAPEGVSTQIVRDVFGKPLEISRSGPDR